jgi:hypothetical protein
MAKKHEADALKFEQQARDASILASKYSGVKAQSLYRDSAKAYISAGYARYQQAIEEETNQIRRNNTLKVAHHNYELAKKLDPSRIGKIQEGMDDIDALLNPTGESSEKKSKKAIKYKSSKERQEPEAETWSVDNPTIAARRLHNVMKKRGDLERRSRSSFAIISILTLLGAVFFVSFNLTGFAISGLALDNSRIIGMCLFVCGLVFAFIYLKGKNKF